VPLVRVVLGRVRDGVLRPLARVETIDQFGMACIECPGCRRVRAWIPSMITTTPSGARSSTLSRAWSDG